MKEGGNVAQVYTEKVDQDIYLIDTECYSNPGFLSAYLVASDRIALIEVGPSTARERVIQGVRQLGFDPADISYIVATHIHLDHVGAAGFLAQDMPQAQVVVHERSARHVIDPSRLMASVMANAPEMMEFDGPMAPTPAERVRGVGDGETIDLGRGRILRFLHTPGHTRTSLGIYEEKSRGIFPGDTLGINFAPQQAALPVSTPPEFDLDATLESVGRMATLPLEVIFFTHFGAERKVAAALDRARARLEELGTMARQALEGGGLSALEEKVKEIYRREVRPVPDRGRLHHYLVNIVAPLSAAGFLQYYQRQGG